MTATPLWQTVTFGLCAGAAVVMQVTIAPDFAFQLVLMAPLVTILGLPHGALDLPIAEGLWPLNGWKGKLRFVAIYLGLLMAVIALWVVLPGPALVLFLAYSALHFSSDWSGAATALRWTGGAATIGAPSLLHHADVTELFSYLAPPAAAGFSADAAAVGGALALGVFIATFPLKRTSNRPVIEQIILWSAAWLLPPLLFFVVYFCGLHSLRHFDAAIRFVPRAKRALFIASGLSGLVTLVAVIFVLAQSVANPLSVNDAAMRAIFIGLAALTVPHMLLVERFCREKVL